MKIALLSLLVLASSAYAQAPGDAPLAVSKPIPAPACTDPDMQRLLVDSACEGTAWNSDPTLSNDDKAQRDEIYALLSFAVVNSDWQESPTEAKGTARAKVARRGHNIGGVLVDPQGFPVWWERNHNYIECNNMNHGETRMIFSYLNYKRSGSIRCHSVYTTLEPCAMCTGVMTLQNVHRTIYNQQDHGFGGAIERLHQAYSPRKMSCSFPQVPIAQPTQGGEYSPALNGLFVKLDAEYHEFLKKYPKGALIEFLVTPEAHDVFAKGQELFLALGNEKRVRPANVAIYAAARLLFDEEISKITFPFSMDGHIAYARAKDSGFHLDEPFKTLRESFKRDAMCKEAPLEEPLIRTTGAGTK